MLFQFANGELIKVFYSANNNGSLDFCGCPHDRNPGVSGRLSWLLKNQMNTDLFLEAGNLFAINQDTTDFEIFNELYKFHQPDLICPGSNDLAYLSSLAKLSSKIVSFNTTNCSSEIVLEKLGVKIGFINAIDPALQSKHGNKVRDFELVKLKQSIKDLKKRCDILFFVSSLSETTEGELFGNCKEIDILISLNRVEQNLDNYGKRFLAAPGHRNAVLGEVTIDSQKRNEIKSHRYFSIDPDSITINEDVDKLLITHRLTKLQKMIK